MGEVIRFGRPDPDRDAYRAAVQEVCALANADDLAPRFLAAHTPLDVVTDLCIWLVFRQKPPRMIARHQARLIGPAGTRRRPMSKWLGAYLAPR